MTQKEKEEALIIYLDDSGKQAECYVDSFSIESGLIIFISSLNKNRISIPMSRLLKIKEKGGMWEDAK